ncbi:glycine/D-amino acid oxidase-like deaminating enzyme [Agromyces ramosus]|uniref:Glycine/D-amino acid oxidase-like deaminating enzyme n=1 Tax=Agromyces ramosus TaxID=33879 RepID=A0A4Q7MPE6_9MICO|nr:FAD-dependent oxidoreductase [Agromyces ramosus]RZS68672.1 glycine/D-amino acid oxidase-like deaminating enzyme [Agromyces ramosus]
MTSLWTDLATADETEPAPTARYEGAVMPGDRFDVAVVGAGITGLATAIMLQRGGSRVVVLEAQRVAALATGANTGKASVLQGAMLQRIRRSHSARVVRAYADANLDGLRWIAEFAEHHGVPTSEETAYSYAATDGGLDLVDRELDAAFEAGLPVERVERMPVSFPFVGAVALPGQLGLDPYRLAVAMARAFVAEGGVLLEGMRVEAVHAGRPVELRTPHGTIRADAAVIATAAPTLLRGLYFAKTRPLRSHLTSYRVEAPPPPGLFITVDAPTRSVRTTPDRDPDAPPLLIVGGNGHPVGRVPSTEARVRDLVAWTKRYFPAADLTHRWAAQDYESANLVPFVGRMPRGLGRIWVATGFAKWGLTNGAAAAIRISEELLGVPWRDRRDWIRVLGTRSTAPADVGRGAAEGARVARAIAVGWGGAEAHPAPAHAPSEGEGVVVSRRGVPYGISTVDGRTCAVRAVCTHLGGVLRWNDAETTWDCPLHGSRFDASGIRIEGPAVHDLPQEPRIRETN